RRGDFASGILVGVNGLLGLANVQTEAAALGMKKKTKGKPIGGFTLALLIIFIIFEILTRSRRTGVFYAGGSSWNHRGGGGFGGSGGGGWSGGGGGFSGGGASGGW